MTSAQKNATLTCEGYMCVMPKHAMRAYHIQNVCAAHALCAARVHMHMHMHMHMHT